MTDWDAYGPPRTYIDNGFLVPDGVGGLLSSFMDAASTSHHIRRIEDSGYTDYAMPSGTNALAMVGDDATGYFLSASLDGVTAADTRNGAPKWTVTGALWSLPVATNLGGGIDMFDGTTLTVLDGEGQPVSTHSVPVAGFELWHSPSSETFIGMAECCEYAALAGPESADESLYSFAGFDYTGVANAGNAQLSGAPSMPDCWTTPPSFGTFGVPDGQRTRLRREYGTYGVHLIPECWMFTDNNGSALFSFQTLNQGHYNVALLTDAFLRPSSSGFSLDAWFSEAQKSEPQISFTINSAFRSPKKNANLKPIAGATNSRHLYGDAADVDTGDVDARYDRLIQAARDLNMWTEPDNGPCKKACAHADLRPATWTPRTLKNMAPYRSGTWDPRW